MSYQDKKEKKIPIDDPTGKWSDLTILPEWEEQYCDVYTVRKHGKWVMLKALKKEFADSPEHNAMLEKEFDVRYNLCHPNLVMVNDLEVVPGVGKAIITDDVYGYSLRQLIDERRLTPKIIHRLQTQLLDAMAYIQENHVAHHQLRPEDILFTEYNENLKIANVGYDRTTTTSRQDTRNDIESYGRIMNEVLDQLPTTLPRLRKIARKCTEKDTPYRAVSDIQLDIERRSSSQIYIFICLFIVIMVALLIWFTNKL